MRKFAEGQSAAVNQAANSTQATLKTLDESQIFSADKFVQKWKAAAREIDSMHRRMNEQINNSRQKDSAGRDLARQQDAMTESFFRQIDAVKKTGSGLEQLAVIQTKLNQAQRAGTISQHDYLTLISSVTQRTTELRRADENLTQQKTRFIQRLKEQVATQNLSRKEMLRYQAAQLGVSSSADIYINKLRDSNKETEKFKDNNKILSEGLRSLAGHMGMSRFTYFGGMGAVVGGMAAVGKAAWNAEQEVTLLNRQLIATGNYAGKTSAQLRLMADQMSGGWITRSDMTAALTSAVGSGYFFGDQVSLVAKAAAQMKQA
ncbi:TPA: phage tail tape measure protein, partial [Morganella morganii]|nr:phage tail tape measure protein [Morganella morganii]